MKITPSAMRRSNKPSGSKRSRKFILGFVLTGSLSESEFAPASTSPVSGTILYSLLTPSGVRGERWILLEVFSTQRVIPVVDSNHHQKRQVSSNEAQAARCDSLVDHRGDRRVDRAAEA